MDGFLPYFTGDGSVGLFSSEFDDIYHSAYGALSEAYEKFVKPLDVNKNNIRILDVCFGLGYNSKAFLNCNPDKNITFDCLDIDRNLILLSPFIKTNNKKRNYKNDNLPEDQREQILRYIKNSKPKNYKIEDWVNHILIKNLYNQFGDDFFLKEILNNKKYGAFFEPLMIDFAKFYQKWRINTINKPPKRLNLHNI